MTKLAAAAEHTGEQAEILEAAVAAAEGKVSKAEDRVKAAKADLAEAKRTAKEARATASQYAKQLAEARNDSGVAVSAGTAAGAGKVN